MTLNILKGHVSPETAYVVDDYPYGFRLRCKIRYWIEYKIGRGFRVLYQTTNPKKPGEVWNKPKASTYASHGACMFLDAQNHVQCEYLTEYSNGEEAKEWAAKYGEGVPHSGQEQLKSWIALKIAYDARPRHAGMGGCD